MGNCRSRDSATRENRKTCGPDSSRALLDAGHASQILTRNACRRILATSATTLRPLLSRSFGADRADLSETGGCTILLLARFAVRLRDSQTSSTAHPQVNLDLRHLLR